MKGFISNWRVKVREESNNVFKVTGQRSTGESFEATHHDPISKIIEFAIYAKKINGKYNIPKEENNFVCYFDTNLPYEVSAVIEKLIIIEILNDNCIAEYSSEDKKYIKLKSGISDDGWYYINAVPLNVETVTDRDGNSKIIYENNEEWQVIEPVLN